MSSKKDSTATLSLRIQSDFANQMAPPSYLAVSMLMRRYEQRSDNIRCTYELLSDTESTTKDISNTCSVSRLSVNKTLPVAPMVKKMSNEQLTSDVLCSGDDWLRLAPKPEVFSCPPADSCVIKADLRNKINRRAALMSPQTVQTTSQITSPITPLASENEYGYVSSPKRRRTEDYPYITPQTTTVCHSQGTTPTYTTTATPYNCNGTTYTPSTASFSPYNSPNFNPFFAMVNKPISRDNAAYPIKSEQVVKQSSSIYGQEQTSHYFMPPTPPMSVGSYNVSNISNHIYIYS